MKDDIYEGYLRPEGAVVHANQWAIHRGEKLYPDPETFNPDRWLNPKYPTFREPLDRYLKLKRFSTFGFGRRICPGLDSAEQALYIGIASLAWACSITLKRDASGKEVPVPWYDYAPGASSAPNMFPFSVVPVADPQLNLMRRATEAETKNSNWVLCLSDPLKIFAFYARAYKQL